ncbi:voltage-dependent anion channel-domain-containing protein [Fusarium tricinctum]|uniref:Voltage-dependent anion channel-domain-containing protein n=1 Tax=Fusarium tricinctum TaxID=61284 RepID=A0A8K0SB00_9HYPO|nr:voltage-dependent anion channel-domain-containing protein [Fusarium tricinctum]
MSRSEHDIVNDQSYDNSQDGSAQNINGHPVDLEAGSPEREKAFPKNEPRPLRLKDRVVRITWGWFPCTMATGGLANLLGEQPYTFTGLQTIGKIFYILNLVLFLTFTALIAARFIMKPRAFSTSLHHPSESFFFGAFWVSLALILTGAQSYGGPATGPWFTTAIRVVFWIYYACEMVVAVTQYHIIFETEKLDLSEALPAWILPAYPFLVTGILAAKVAGSQPQWSAVQIIIAGLMGQGLGWMLALFIYAVYLSRLIQHQLPAASKRPGMFIAVGPTAFTCAGLISLGTQAKSILPDDFLGSLSFPIGELWYGISIATGLFIWLVAIWFSALSALSVLRASRKMEFSLSWWALVFPNVGLALATINVGKNLSSRGIQVFGSALTIVLVIVWFICAAAHIRALIRRDLLAVGKDLEVEHVNKQHDRKAAKRAS